MRTKGFLFIEVLMGLFLLGIITVTCLPILNASFNNLRLSEAKMEMMFLAESTIEQLKSFNYNIIEEDEYLFDIQLTELINRFTAEDNIIILLPLDKEDNKFNYTCTIYKNNNSKDLWEIWAEISPSDEGRKIKNVKLLAFMPVPQENYENVQK